MSSEERLIKALSLEEPDRVPLLELGINPYPLLKIITFWRYLPNKLKKIIKRTGFYEEYVDVVRNNFGMGTNVRSLFRKPLKMNWSSRFLFSVPTNWKQNYQTLLLYYLPIKLLTCYDAIGFPVFPSTKIIAKKNQHLIIESGMAVDIDPRTTNIRWRSVAYPLKDNENISIKQLEFLSNSMENFDWDFSIKTYKKLKKIGICMPITCLGFWEIWDSLYGVSKLSKYYYQMSKEFRRKKGPILDIWNKMEVFFIEIIKRFSEIDVKIIGLLDDLVYDDGPFVNPEYYRKFLYPHYKKVVDYAHKKGMKIFLHTDGKLDTIIQDIIKINFDGLQSIQADINNFKDIKERYGNKICLIGGISSKRLGIGSINDIYTETKRKTLIGKQGGGYIAGSDNMIHDEVKTDNLFTMIRTVRKFGKY